MENKLKHLRSSMDKTVFRDGDLKESDKSAVKAKIKQHQSRQVNWIFKRNGMAMKSLLGTAVCLLLIAATIFAVKQGEQTSSELPYSQLLSNEEGKLTFLYVNDGSNPRFMQEMSWGKVMTGGKFTPLSLAEEIYPELEINDSPVYIFFDTEGVVFRSVNEQKAESFLREQFQFSKFEQTLNEADVQANSIIWVETYDTNLDDHDETAMVVFKTPADRIATGKLKENKGAWEWVDDSKQVLDNDHSFNYQVTSLGKFEKVVHGVYLDSTVSRVQINDYNIQPNTIQLDAGKTFWYLEVESLNAITAYSKEDGVVYNKSFPQNSDDNNQNKTQSFTEFYRNDALSEFVNFQMTLKQRNEIRKKLQIMNAGAMSGTSFIPSNVPKNSKLIGIDTFKNNTAVGPYGPHLVLKFNSFKIEVQVRPEKGGFRQKGETIEAIAVHKERAEWLKRPDSYALTLYDNNRVITISSRLESISHTDVEKIAGALIPLK